MYRLLAFIPFIMLVFAIPYVNREEPYILGLPFLLFWIALWVVLSSLIMLAVYLLEDHDQQASTADQDQKPADNPQVRHKPGAAE